MAWVWLIMSIDIWDSSVDGWHISPTLGTSEATWYSVWFSPSCPFLICWMASLCGIMEWMSMVSMYTMGCFTKIPMHLTVFNPRSIEPVASTMWKRNIHFWLFQKHLIILGQNCLILLPPYIFRVVQSTSSFFSALPLESIIAGHLSENIYWPYICTHMSVYFAFCLHGISFDLTICVFCIHVYPCEGLWSFSPLYVVDCCHCGALSYLLSCWFICDINGVNLGYTVKAVNCAIICNTNTAFALMKWMGDDLGSHGLVPGWYLMVVVCFLCNFCTCWPWFRLLLEDLHKLSKCPTWLHYTYGILHA